MHRGVPRLPLQPDLPERGRVLPLLLPSWLPHSGHWLAMLGYELGSQGPWSALTCSSLSFPHPAAAPHLFPPPDVNECLQFPPPCAFECRNLRGSYECLCPAGRTLLPGGQCGTAGTDAGDTMGSVPQDTPLHWQGLSSHPRGRSFYTQLALRRVAKDVGMGARSPPCPMGYIRRNGTCTGECPLGKGVAGSSETTLSPKDTLCPSCCPVHHFLCALWSLLCWEEEMRARLAPEGHQRGLILPVLPSPFLALQTSTSARH